VCCIGRYLGQDSNATSCLTASLMDQVGLLSTMRGAPSGQLDLGKLEIEELVVSILTTEDRSAPVWTAWAMMTSCMSSNSCTRTPHLNRRCSPQWSAANIRRALLTVQEARHPCASVCVGGPPIQSTLYVASGSLDRVGCPRLHRSLTGFQLSRQKPGGGGQIGNPVGKQHPASTETT
jgi:hypothetical protein